MRRTSSLRPGLRGVLCALALIASSQACVLDADLGGWESDAAADADLTGAEDASSSEANAEPPVDAGCVQDAGGCGGGDGGTHAGTGSGTLTVSLGPTTTYFADGRSLPAGEYTLVYLDGCWKSGVVAWTVNLGTDGYVVVGGQPERRLAMAPGTVGTFAGLGAYGLYEDCVAANVGRPGVTFQFEGGPLGLKLETFDPLISFILLEGGESVGGRSPTFGLTCSGSCR